MFAWFQRLLPKSGDFFGMFERHGAATLAAAEALGRLLRGEGDRLVHIQAIHDREHDADEVIREVLGAVRRTFLTPFDRGAITALIGAMDDTIDEIEAAATAIEIYGVTTFDAEMKEMAQAAEEAIRLVVESLPLLRALDRNGHRLHDLTGRIVAIEGDVDRMHERGLKASFEAQREQSDPLGFIVSREIYKHLEKIADSFEDVAKLFDGLDIDHA